MTEAFNEGFQQGPTAGEIHPLLHIISPHTLIENCVKWRERHEIFFYKHDLGLHWPTFIPKAQKTSEFLVTNSFKNSSDEQLGRNP